MAYYTIASDLRTGMRVKVVRQHKYMNTRLIGKVGTVRNPYGAEISVRIDGMQNTYSATGLFYLRASELEIINENDIVMEENVDMPNVTNYLNTVKIQYVDNVTPSNYIYANYDPDVKVGDLCVIKSSHHGLGLARITEIIDRNDFETCREVVAKVNTECYDERVACRAKAAELKAKMQDRAKKLQDIALYQMLAEKDSAMMELLTEYQAVPQL